MDCKAYLCILDLKQIKGFYLLLKKKQSAQLCSNGAIDIILSRKVLEHSAI